MPTKLQQLRKEQVRRLRTRARKRGFEQMEAKRREAEVYFYGTLGPASPTKRIDPQTGDVLEVIFSRQN